MPTKQTAVNVFYEPNQITIQSAFDFELVNGIRSCIPSHDSKWDNVQKIWYIHPRAISYLDQVLDSVRKSKKVIIRGDRSVTGNYAPFIHSEDKIEIHYVGKVYKRNAGEQSAFGWYKDGWNAVFINNSLQSYFKVSVTETLDSSNYYNTLVIPESATQEQIRKAYRMIVKQWHPDVCSEPNAREQFELIQKAYRVLIDEDKKSRYDFGLKFERNLSKQKSFGKTPKITPEHAPTFNPMIKCGIFTADVEYALNRVFIYKIHGISEILDDQGHSMVSSWKDGDEHFTIRWV